MTVHTSITQTPLHLTGIQACRGMAALLVLLYHNGANYFPIYMGYSPSNRPSGPDWFDFGHAGVDFFFVLSGFIIFWVHEKDFDRPRQIVRYALRRFVRIFPTFWAALALVVAGYFVRPELGGGYERSFDAIFHSALLIPQERLPVLTQAWTLSHEMVFYLLFAIMIIRLRIGMAAFSLWLLIIGLIKICGADASFPFSFVGNIHNVQFFLGMAAGLILRKSTITRPRLLAFAGAGLFLANGLFEAKLAARFVDSVAPFGMGPYGDGSKLTYAFASMVLILGLVEAERQRLLRFSRGWVLLGEASYSIYLINNIALSVAARVLRKLELPAVVDGWAAFILLAMLALACGLVFHAFVERPCLKIGNTWAARINARVGAEINK